MHPSGMEGYDPVPPVFLGLSYGMMNGRMVMDCRLFSQESEARIWPLTSDAGNRCAVVKVIVEKEVRGEMYVAIVYKVMDDGRIAIDPGVFDLRQDALDFCGQGDHGLGYVIFRRELDSIASDEPGEWGTCRGGSGAWRSKMWSATSATT